MPELPEVESVVRALRASSLIGKTLSSLEILCPKVPRHLTTLRGRRVLAIDRRGKYIQFSFSKGLHLLVHLRMTGQFLIKPAGESAERHERVIFSFKDMRVAFHDTRRFATFDLTDQPETIFSRLGPEPLDPAFTPEMFYSGLSKRNKVIKALLLDQGVIAGVGNIYADEALWEAQIHPERPSCDLSKKEVMKLFNAVRKVLAKGIENGGTSLGGGAQNFHHLNGQSGGNQNTLQAYGKEGEPCIRCGHPIERIVVQQRGTHFCPICQP